MLVVGFQDTTGLPIVRVEDLSPEIGSDKINTWRARRLQLKLTGNRVLS